MHASPIDEASDIVRAARRLLVLTGAGISAESGIAPFRGKGGIWARYDPMEYGTLDALRADPAKVWRMLYDLGLEIAAARPNAAHHALVRLEPHLHLTIATQNVDALHQRAGSTDVVELHGSSQELLCMACGRRWAAADVVVDALELPPRCGCGGALRPDVVLFGELLPPGVFERAEVAARTADVVLVVGTSAEVAPAAWLPTIALRAGARIIELNPETTWLTTEVTHVFLHGKAGEILPELVAAVIHD